MRQDFADLPWLWHGRFTAIGAFCSDCSVADTKRAPYNQISCSKNKSQNYYRTAIIVLSKICCIFAFSVGRIIPKDVCFATPIGGIHNKLVMIVQTMIRTKARPFLKWAGGKTQLLPTIDSYLPKSFRKEKDITYIEPFVGGGAMLFYMLQTYPNIKRAIINDINPHLIATYTVIRDTPFLLIDNLKEIETHYRSLEEYDAQKEYYLSIRRKFNSGNLSSVEEAAYMIFMNRTCFNGLYRENSKGDFNVPFGKYTNPTICDDALIVSDSELLQKVEILNGDFSKTGEYTNNEYTFLYFDPPYRPLDATSSFNSYVKEAFNDDEQRRLKDFFAYLSAQGCMEMLSNSDCKGRNEEDTFFDDLYRDFHIERVYAKRSINANASKRGTLTELLIRNYENYQGFNGVLF